jgi:putative DNA primase/helicase
MTEDEFDRLKAELALAKKQLGWAKASEARTRIEAMISLAKSEPGIPRCPDEFDRDPWLLNCLNGTIDLRTGQLREHRREDFLTKLAPVEFDPDAPCPAWERFLNQVFPAEESSQDAEPCPDEDLIEFVQRWFGYCLTGSVHEQKMAIFHGDGSNGKSVISNVLLGILGDHAGPAAPKLLACSKHDGGGRHPTEIADLHGKRMVIAFESGEDDRLNETMVKWFTGGDRLKARGMGEDFWEFDPTHKLIFQTNHMPTIRGDDHGIWRRLLLVPFAVRFWDPATPPQPNESRPDHLRADPTLPHRLRAEWPGILAWAVRGCLSWQHDGLRVPKRVMKATSDYRASEDLIEQFLAEACVRAEGGEVRSSAMLDAMNAWLRARGEKAEMSQRRLGDGLRTKGFESKRSNGIWWLGLTLRPIDAEVFA